MRLEGSILDEKYLINTVKNGMQILRLFNEDSPEWSLTEIAKEKSLKISTTKRLVDTLTAYGYLDKDPISKKYRLSLAIVGLSGVLTTTMEIYQEARPLLLNLSEKHKGDAHIGVLEETTVVYLDKIESTHTPNLTATSHIGKRNPSYCTGSGKILLANKPTAVQQDLLEKLEEQGFDEYASNTVKTSEELKEDLDKIVVNGYEESIDELLDGITTVAVPVFDFTDQVIAAISLTGPSNEINISTCLDDLIAASDIISEKLGYIKPSWRGG